MIELTVIVQQVDDSVPLMLTGIDTPIEGSEFSLCELQELDKTMQTYRGELVNNIGRLKELDDYIRTEEAKIKNNLPQDDENR